MKKIKISELPLYSTLKGLFTIGTDANNNSVKVSLEFVEQETTQAVSKANAATAAANNATAEILAAFGGIVPFTLEVECMERITLGNLSPKPISVVLTPAGTLKNVIFLCDNKAVTVAPDGRIQVVAKGRSTVHVIPTMNTALAKTLQIEVTAPSLRMVNTRKQLRFTQGGALRLN